MNVRAFLELARISNLPTVWSNCLAAWLIEGTLEARNLVLGLAGGSLVYTGGMFLNDYCDREFDRAHRTERPIPSGRSSARAAGWIAAILLVAGTGLLMFVNLVPALVLTGLVVLYDFWHKRNPISPVLMAACRVTLVLTIAHRAGWTLALSLGLYILSISMVAKREAFGGGRVPWVGIAVLALSFAVTPFISSTQPRIWAWLLPLVALWPLRFVVCEAKEIGKCVAGLLAAIPLLDLWNTSLQGEASVKVAALFLLMSCSALLLQRIAPAT